MTAQDTNIGDQASLRRGMFHLMLLCGKSHVCGCLGEFRPTRENVMNLTFLRLYRDTNTMGVAFKEEDEEKLQQLISSIGYSKVPNKSTYASWIRYFDERREPKLFGVGGPVRLLAFLVYFAKLPEVT